MESEDASQTQACAETHRAAVTTHEFGDGRSLYTAFDLLMQAADTSQSGLLDDLLSSALGYVHPAAIQQLPNRMVPVTVTVFV